MATRSGGIDDDDYNDRLHECHRKGYDLLREALKLDESFTSCTKKTAALNYYRKGIEELETGLATSLRNCHVSRGNEDLRERRLRLQEKMLKNLTMAKDRVVDLEKLLKSSPAPVTFSTPPRSSTSTGRHSNQSPRRPNTTTCTTPTSSGRAFSPARRLPLLPPSPLAPKQLAKANQPTPPKTSDEISNQIKQIKGVDTKLAHQILDQVLERKSNITFADIAGLDDAKRALRETVILPALNPTLFTGLRSPAQGLLLFGPPGNGKTMLAKAVAAESNCVFFNISASDIASKWVGEAEKLVKALFALSRHLQPAIVFIDEVDSILCQRSQNEHEASRRLKTEFLLQFDGVASSAGDRILVMGATNRPFDLDEAVLRRFPKRIFVPLPCVESRQELLRKLLTKHANSALQAQDIRSIAAITDGYSSSDLTVLAKEAAMGPLRDVPPDKLLSLKDYQLRPISYADFREATRKIKPTTKREQLQELEKFNQSYGS